MKHETYFILLLLTIAYGCKKPDIPQNEPAPAGVQTTGWTYVDNGAGVTFTINWDADLLYGNAVDSFDLDNNGIYDIEFQLNVINPDSSHLLVGMPNPFPNFRAIGKNGVSIASISNSEPIGLGQSTTNYFVKNLNQGDDMSKETLWRGAAPLWQENPVGWYPGPWSGVQQTYYLAFKKFVQVGNTNYPKYGWIEIDCTEKDNPKLIRWSMQ